MKFNVIQLIESYSSIVLLLVGIVLFGAVIAEMTKTLIAGSLNDGDYMVLGAVAIMSVLGVIILGSRM